MPNSPVQAAVEGLPKSDDVAAAMRSLEYEVFSVRKLASVLRELIEKEFNAGAGQDYADVVLCGDARETLEFMADEVVSRTSRLEEAYRAAWRGEKKQ